MIAAISGARGGNPLVAVKRRKERTDSLLCSFSDPGRTILPIGEYRSAPLLPRVGRTVRIIGIKLTPSVLIVTISLAS